MTVIVGYHLGNWGVLMSDSRATRGFDGAVGDCLQKLITIEDRIVLGYAGSVSLATSIIDKLRDKLREVTSLEDFSRIFADICRDCSSGVSDPVDFLVFVRDIEARNIKLYSFKHDDLYAAICMDSSFAVIGSGSVIEDILDEKRNDIFGSSESHQTIKSKILLQVKNAIAESGGLSDVGGLLQAFLVSPKGIFPIRHGQFSVEPEGSYSLEMELKEGTWCQSNLTTGEDLEISSVDKIQDEFSTAVFLSDDNLVPPTKEVYLSYFIPCFSLERSIGQMSFNKIFRAVLVKNLPSQIKQSVFFGVRSVSGNFAYKVIVRDIDNNELWSDGDNIHSADPTVTHDVEVILDFECELQGMYFLGLEMNGSLVARRPFFVKQSALILPPSVIDSEIRKYSDPLVVDGDNVFVDLFQICGSSVTTSDSTQIQNRVFGLSTPSFPFHDNFEIIASFRGAVGYHVIQLILNDIQERGSRSLSIVPVTVEHELIHTGIKGKIPIIFAHAGPYRLDLLIDGVFQTSLVILVDDVNRANMFNLLPQQIREANSLNRFMILPEDAIPLNV